MRLSVPPCDQFKRRTPGAVAGGSRSPGLPRERFLKLGQAFRQHCLRLIEQRVTQAEHCHRIRVAYGMHGLSRKAKRRARGELQPEMHEPSEPLMAIPVAAEIPTIRRFTSGEVILER